MADYRHNDGFVRLHHGDFFSVVNDWPDPVCIMSDGPYGIEEGRGGYAGDGNRIENLADFYRPFIDLWSARATPQTTLWFWCSEEGWAEVHSLIVKAGWEFRGFNVWDKGIAHIAGNCNTQTMRKFPTVTEACVHYVRKCAFALVGGGSGTLQDWFRSEWRRTGLPFREANVACGVANAATRKYLTGDHLWYMPPADVFAKLSFYANERGAVEGRPYFDLGGSPDASLKKYEAIRAKFSLPAGVTNVWSASRPNGKARLRIDGEAHPNQKPYVLIDRVLRASSEAGDVIWEPFGGTCPSAEFALREGRSCYASELVESYVKLAELRINGVL